MIALVRISLVIVFGGMVIAVCLAQDREKEPVATESGFSCGSYGEVWTRTIDYNTSGYAERPNDDAFRSVFVRWADPEIDGLGNHCTVRGQLWISSKVSGQVQPIDWFQGVTVYVATSPGSEPNWSHGTTAKTTYLLPAVVGDSGKFDVMFDLKDSERDRQQSQKFQFGLSLAKHTQLAPGRQQVEWTSETPVIASTTTMLTIPAAPVLSPELELVNNAAGWPFSHEDGTKLIRAVNALRKLGKDDSLAMLETYVEMRRKLDLGYDPDEETVFWIIRLLFEPIQLEDRIPPPLIAVYLDRDEADATLWPLDPIVLVDGIPYMVGQRIMMGGMPEHPSSHIQWARRYGVIREAPLRPTCDPLAAAEKLLSSRLFNRLKDDAKEEAQLFVKTQAVTMVSSILGPLTEDEEVEPMSQEKWKARLKSSKELGITWSDEEERFVVTRPPKQEAQR